MADAKQLPDGSPLRFGNYWLDAELAQGGMSRLVRARLRGPGGFEKKLVVKQILPQLAQDPAFIEMFVHEANTLVQMSHPNIVPVYELGVIDGVYFLSMELVEGATVAEVLRDGPLDEALCAHIGAQVCDALRYAHERFGLVHRDVTPRNVIVDADGHVRLLDFGIAAPPALTGRGELFGSPGYMSPEQIRGLPLSGQSDLFSLGTVLYEALTGTHALPERDQGKRDSLPPRLEAGAARSDELTALLNTLLARDPALRPGSAADAGTRFRTWLAQRHPQGVAAALGRRAEQARARSEAASEAPPAPIATEPSQAPRVTRTIATNRNFVELMASGTERIARNGQADAAAASELDDPQRASRVRLAQRAAAALLLLAIASVVLLRMARSEAPSATARALPVQAATADPMATAMARADSIAKTRPNPAPKSKPGSESESESGSESGSESDSDSDSDSVASTSTSTPTPNSPRAHLTINALPWAEVHIDGRSLGATPQRAVALSAGAHTLQLDCPPLGKQARIPLKLSAGADQHILVDLHTDPPRVAIR